MLEYIWKPIIVFVVGYILLRALGKKAVSEMTSFDILIVFVIGTVISDPIMTKKLWPNTIHLVVISLTYFLFSKLTIQNGFKEILTAEPTVLVHNGDIDEMGLHKERLSVDALMGILRSKGYVDVRDLELVMMERNGSVSVIPKATIRPLQPNDIQLHPSPTFLPIPLIIDGKIIDVNLTYIKKSHDWLIEQMKAYNLTFDKLSIITLATYNQHGYVDFDLKK